MSALPDPQDLRALSALQELGAPAWTGRRVETEAQRVTRHNQRSVILVEVARRAINRGLDGFKPEIVFARPGDLPEDDGELAWHLRVASLPRASKPSKDIASQWYGFRNHVLDAEAKDEGSVVCLLRMLANCERAPDSIGVEYAKAVRRFLGAEYARAQLPDEIVAECEPEWRRLVAKLVRRTEVIPTWLLHFPTIGRVPKGTTMKAPSSVTDTSEPTPEEKNDGQEEIPF